LGQNGIWGDLLKISPEGLVFFHEALGYYKKINKENGKGAMVVFSSHKGSYEYVSRSKPDQKYWSTKGVDLTFDKDGYAVIKVSFEKADAKIIFFGVEKE